MTYDDPASPLLTGEPSEIVSQHRKRLRHLLEFYSSHNHTLEYVSGEKILNRSLPTLKKYCREFGIGFSDYTPRAMRAKVE